MESSMPKQSFTSRLNGLIGGAENAVKSTVARVKKNMAEDSAGLKTGKVGRYQYTNPFRK